MLPQLQSLVCSRFVAGMGSNSTCSHFCIFPAYGFMSYVHSHANVLFYSEVNAGFFYKSAEEREKLVEAERKFTNDKVNKVIQLKKEVSLCFK